MSPIDEDLSRALKALREPVDAESSFRRVSRLRRRRRLVRPIQAATLAAAVIAGSALGTYGLVRTFSSAPETLPDEATQPTSSAAPGEPLPPYEDPWRDLDPGVSDLPPPPSTRVGPAIVWTGREVVVWGGAVRDGEVLYDDGFALDARSRKWEPLPASPLSPRYFPAAVWTGREVLIWGGWDGGDGYFADGAAYDPAGGRWRPLAPSPLDARFPRGAVWTGSEMIVWGSGPPMRGRRDTTGAAYDPATDSWRRIADGPHPINWGSVVWTGREMAVVGASVHGPNRPDTANAVAAAYDPASDRWRELPETNLDPNGTFATWAGEFLLAVDYNHRVQGYDPQGDRWRPVPSIPLGDGEDWPTMAGVDDDVLVNTFSGYAAFDGDSSAWSRVDIPPSRDGTPVPAGDVIVIWEGDPEGQPPDSLLVWKPT